jgi:CRP/FNR family cyclic AMP-dependent transcriptional regulator
MTPTKLEERAFFHGMDPAHVAVLERASGEECFAAGSLIFREGGEASRWYLITEGVVILEIDVPGRGPHIVQTLHEGDVLGWSWLFPPYRWSFDAYARTEVEAIGFDAAFLRSAKQEDQSLGYELMKRFAQVLVQRMQAARLQLLDMYGTSR